MLVNFETVKITRTIDVIVHIKYEEFEAICNRIVGLVKYAAKEVWAISDPDCTSVGVFYWAQSRKE